VPPVRLTARNATIELAETFVIARSAQDTADVVYVELEHDGVTGYGEATPIERYDQSAESALDYLEGNADALGDDP
jgi:L-Ala-D/L-Glu epimerase